MDPVAIAVEVVFFVPHFSFLVIHLAYHPYVFFHGGLVRLACSLYVVYFVNSKYLVLSNPMDARKDAAFLGVEVGVLPTRLSDVGVLRVVQGFFLRYVTGEVSRYTFERAYSCVGFLVAIACVCR